MCDDAIAAYAECVQPPAMWWEGGVIGSSVWLKDKVVFHVKETVAEIDVLLKISEPLKAKMARVK